MRTLRKKSENYRLAESQVNSMNLNRRLLPTLRARRSVLRQILRWARKTFAENDNPILNYSDLPGYLQERMPILNINPHVVGCRVSTLIDEIEEIELEIRAILTDCDERLAQELAERETELDSIVENEIATESYALAPLLARDKARRRSIVFTRVVTRSQSIYAPPKSAISAIPRIARRREHRASGGTRRDTATQSVTAGGSDPPGPSGGSGGDPDPEPPPQLKNKQGAQQGSTCAFPHARGELSWTTRSSTRHEPHGTTSAGTSVGTYSQLITGERTCSSQIILHC